jgi:hypothetical protein
LATVEQVPREPPRLQASQVPLQGPSQQRPSVQKVLMQSAPLPQLWPSLARQTPPASQAKLPWQKSSSALVTVEQVPTLPTRLQASQGLLQLLLQQTPSLQMLPAHSELMEQLCPVFFRQVPEPLQVLSPSHLPALSALVTFVQVPGVAEQVWQAPVQVLLQQKPSRQVLLAHWLFRVQLWPVFRRQVPEPLQVLLPVQVSGSSALVTVVQVPGVEAQVWQVPVQAVPQQTPSLQMLLAHWLLRVQLCPALRLHTPEPLQVWVPSHLPALSALVTVVQVPGVEAQVLQAPVQVELQQKPSRHILLWQCELSVQG